jgi:hypothetical protein
MTVFVLPKQNPFIKCCTCLRKKQLLTKYKKNKLKQQLLKRTLSNNLIFFSPSSLKGQSDTINLAFP